MDFKRILDELRLTESQLAQFLSVNIRSVRRWIKYPYKITGPARNVILAWVRLNRLGMAWRPDEINVLNDHQIDEIAEKIKFYRLDSLKLDKILIKVKERGGPSAPWNIDIDKKVAILGPLRIDFHLLTNGIFCPVSYSRSDCEPDLLRDQILIEDAYFLIDASINSLKSLNIS
jgi:hypothetical protein